MSNGKIYRKKEQTYAQAKQTKKMMRSSRSSIMRNGSLGGERNATEKQRKATVSIHSISNRENERHTYEDQKASLTFYVRISFSTN